MDIGFNHLFLHTATPGVPHDVRRVWTKRFAEEVVPRFRGTAKTAVPSPAIGTPTATTASWR